MRLQGKFTKIPFFGQALAKVGKTKAENTLLRLSSGFALLNGGEQSLSISLAFTPEGHGPQVFQQSGYKHFVITAGVHQTGQPLGLCCRMKTLGH